MTQATKNGVLLSEWALKRLDQVLGSDDERFDHLLEIAGLDPTRDLRFADLRGVDFNNSILDGWDFTGADLTNASFRGARVIGCTFEKTVGADLGGAEVVGRPADRTHRGIEEASPLTSEAFRSIDLYEPRPELYGREGEIEKVVGALIEGRSAIIAGGPGMGKTAVAVAAMYDQRVIAHFGRRRAFVSLETEVEPRAIMSRLATAFGVSADGDEPSLLRLLQLNTAEHRTVVVLDNAESIVDADRSGADRILRLVAQMANISLVVTLRGTAPAVPESTVIDLPPLSATAARQAFTTASGDTFADDSCLPKLLAALEGHALSLTLVGAQARGLPSLKGLLNGWNEAHAEILRRPGEKESRLTSVRASLELSLANPRLRATPLARRLLAVLAYLPGGLPEEDVRLILGDRGTLSKAKCAEAVSCVRQLRLVEPRSRLRMLTPLRECVQVDVPIYPADRLRMVARFLALAADGQSIGTFGWERVRTGVEEEADNLDPVCTVAVDGASSHPSLPAALSGLAEYHRFSGRASIVSVERALSLLRKRAPSELTAQCMEWIAGVSIAQANMAQAEAYLGEALPYFQRIGSPIGHAQCLMDFGDIEGHRYRDGTAIERFVEARELYRKAGSKRGEASATLRLGETAVKRSDSVGATSLFREAVALFRASSRGAGEANCVAGMGELAFWRLDLDEAERLREEALLVFQRVGSVRAIASSFVRLATIAVQRGDYDKAFSLFNRAEEVNRTVANPHGEALCINIMGEAALRLGNLHHALERFDESLELYRRYEQVPMEARTLIRRGQTLLALGDVSGRADIDAGFAKFFAIADTRDLALPGWRAMYASLSKGIGDDSQGSRALARKNWTEIGRLDLVEEWIDFEPPSSLPMAR